MTAAAGWPYGAVARRRADQVFGLHGERISKLETGMARMEVSVEQLANTVASEHKANQEVRREDRAELKEHITKMEQSVIGLATEMQKIAERTAAVDNNVLTKQSQAIGAFDSAKYIISIFLIICGLYFAYKQGERRDYVPPPGHYYAPSAGHYYAPSAGRSNSGAP